MAIKKCFPTSIYSYLLLGNALFFIGLGICTSSELDGRPPEEMYVYNDEIGTPYCITILESTLSNGVVALRNRDTTLQEFIHISDVFKTLQSHLKTV